MALGGLAEGGLLEDPEGRVAATELHGVDVCQDDAVLVVVEGVTRDHVVRGVVDEQDQLTVVLLELELQRGMEVAGVVDGALVGVVVAGGQGQADLAGRGVPVAGEVIGVRVHLEGEADTHDDAVGILEATGVLTRVGGRVVALAAEALRIVGVTTLLERVWAIDGEYPWVV